ncbi:outer membrane beta-barrel protein [Tamlana haliotis]|uniref:Outer membrane beta-barrel protein n=1 Tax=Pseudotamlana haliotis TaxID=2614804 RepID=A0A6N6M8A9_9FLAO|nr:outer membrane beta-barrel protein [Tamlana haliotis]KAB1066494.1 outer membrane beta-barrel protein [Tamlana haliotis]
MKVKFIALLISTLFLSNSTYSQDSNEFRTYFGLMNSEFLSSEILDGSGNYDLEDSYEFGIRYLRKLTPKLSLETGINYLSSKVQINSNSLGTNNQRHTYLKMVSIPMYFNYTIGSYFFLNGGPQLDFQNSGESFDSQSGFGLGIGFGGKYNFKRFLIYLNPNLKMHALIPFKKEDHQQSLTEFGVQLGIGYQF